MGLFPAHQVGRKEDDAATRAASVAEIDKTQYNAAAVDEDGNAFLSTAGAAAALEALSVVDITAITAGGSNIAASTETAAAGDVLPIPITGPLCLKTTAGDAEALTLADGTYIGQTLTIQLVADGGGVGTLTPVTSTSFGTIIFADAGDLATVVWRGATTGWVLIGTCDLAGVGGPVYTLA